MLELKITDQPVLQALRNAVQAMNGRQRTELMRNISGEMHAAVMQNFEDGGRPQWDKLKPRTIAARKKTGNWPGQILVRRGDLRRSITQRSDASSAVVGSNAVYAAIHQMGGTIQKKARASTVRLRTDAKGRLLRQPNHPSLAVFARQRGKSPHKRFVERQSTTKAHSIHMPARPFLQLTPQDLADLTEEVNAWFGEIVRQQGLG